MGLSRRSIKSYGVKSALIKAWGQKGADKYLEVKRELINSWEIKSWGGGDNYLGIKRKLINSREAINSCGQKEVDKCES